ncbi:hypothetical protein ACP275_07G104000 [Erythranthe tilingii]
MAVGFPNYVDALVEQFPMVFTKPTDPEHIYIRDFETVVKCTTTLLNLLSDVLVHVDKQINKVLEQSRYLPKKLKQWSMEAAALKREGSDLIEKQQNGKGEYWRLTCEELIEVGIEMINHLKKCPVGDEYMYDKQLPFVKLVTDQKYKTGDESYSDRMKNADAPRTWMFFRITKLIAQMASAVYDPCKAMLLTSFRIPQAETWDLYYSCKDMLLRVKREKQDIDNSEGNLVKLVTNVMLIKSRMNEIDKILRESVSTEKSEEYEIVKLQIDSIMCKYNKFIMKYQKVIVDIPAGLDVSFAESMIGELQQRKPRILARNFCKIAQLNRDIAKLDTEVCLVLDIVKLDYLTVEKKMQLVQRHGTVNFPIPMPYASSNDNTCKNNFSNIIRELMIIKSFTDEIERSLPKKKTKEYKMVEKQLKTFRKKRKEIHSKLEKLSTNNAIENKRADKLQPRKLKMIKNSVSRKLTRLINDISRLKIQVSSVLVKVMESNNYQTIEKLPEVVEAKHGEYVNEISEDWYLKHWNPLQIEDAVEEEDYRPTSTSDVHDDLISAIHPQESNSHVGFMLRCQTKRQSTSEITEEVRNFSSQQAPSDVHDDVISAIPPQDSNSDAAYTSQYQTERQSTSEITEEVRNFSPQQAAITSSTSYGEIPSVHETPTSSSEGEMIAPELQIKMVSDSPVQQSKHFGETSDQEFIITIPFNNKDLIKLDISSTSFSEEILNDACGLISDKKMIVIRTGSDNMPTYDEWGQARVVNLEGKKFHEVPEVPHCADLALLFLQGNNYLTHIPTSFFDCMPLLRLLDLSNTRIMVLPDSLFTQTKLQVLLARSCVCLDKIPTAIKEVSENIQVLDLWGTELYDLCCEIRLLKRLRRLQLSFYLPDDGRLYAHLPSVLISEGVLSELQALQSLSITVHPEDQRWIKIAIGIMKDVASLEKLNHLDFYFPTIQGFEFFIQTSPSWNGRKLNKFKWVVGLNVKRVIDRVPEEVELEYEKHDRSLRFVNADEAVPAEAVKTVLKSATAFYLDHHLQIKSLSEFGISNFKELKFCVVRECPKFRDVVGEDAKSSGIAFPKLEYLGLHYLWELEKISKHPVTRGSFEALKHLTVSTCPKLEYILSQSMLRCLSSLETFTVKGCESLKVIVKGYEMTTKCDLLPRLKKLVLRHLPQLVNLGCGLCPSNDKISAKFCPKFEKPRRLPCLPCNCIGPQYCPCSNY